MDLYCISPTTHASGSVLATHWNISGINCKIWRALQECRNSSLNNDVNSRPGLELNNLGYNIPRYTGLLVSIAAGSHMNTLANLHSQEGITLHTKSPDIQGH